MKLKPLRILFVSRDKFPPFRVDVAVLFGKEMIRKGHRIDLVLQSESDCKTMYRTNWHSGTAWVGPTVNGERLTQRIHKHLIGFFHSIRCTKLLSEIPYSCVQLKDRFFTAIVYLVAARLYKTSYFYWLSYPFAEASLLESKTGLARYPLIYLIRGIIYRILLYKIIMKHADHVFVQSEQMKIDIQAKGIPRQKITPVPMGFEPYQFQFDKKFCDIPKAEEFGNVVYLGTLIRIRKLDFIIRMFALVLKKVTKAKLYLVGKGETDQDTDYLKNEANKLGILDSVIFTGFVERSLALQIVRSGSVCVSPFFPSPVLNSTSPTKLVEYMALGKAVVANDHPEQKFVIEQSGGGICVPYREADFANAVIYLLTHLDVNRRMGEKGKKWVFQNRSYSKIADLVETKIFQELGLE